MHLYFSSFFLKMSHFQSAVVLRLFSPTELEIPQKPLSFMHVSVNLMASDPVMPECGPWLLFLKCHNGSFTKSELDVLY